MRSAVVVLFLSLLAVPAGGCYPDFQFGPGAGGAGTSTDASSALSSTATGSKTTSAQSSAASTTSTADSASSSAASSTSSGMTGPAPPCNTAAPCTNELCCFNKTENTDTCGATCGSNYLSLKCHDYTDCPGTELCCTVYGTGGLGALKGTECHDTCIAFDRALACDPTDTVQVCTCNAILDAFYQSGTAPAPYDQYGECQ